MEENGNTSKQNFQQDEETPHQKPHILVQIFLAIYGLLMFTMIVTAGLSSLHLGYIDYDSGSIALALILAYPFVIKYF